MKKIMYSKTLAILVLTVTQGIALLGQPPLAPVKPVTDDYFGQKIVDHYRYMENTDDPIVQDWLKSQSEHARSVLDSIPGRKDIIDSFMRMIQSTSVFITSLVITENDRYFYIESGKLYYRDGMQGQEIMLFDPANFSPEENKNYLIKNPLGDDPINLFPNADGSKIAFGIIEAGSENTTIVCMDVNTKKLYEERIFPCITNVCSWLPDGERFIYNKPNIADWDDTKGYINTISYIHKLGTDPKTDQVVISDQEYPEWGIRPVDYPLAEYHQSAKKLFGVLYNVEYQLRVFLAESLEISDKKINWKEIFTYDDQIKKFLTDDTYIYALTTKDAPNLKIIRKAIHAEVNENPVTLIPENEEAIIKDFVLTKDGMYYTLLKNGVEAQLYFLEKNAAKPTQLKLPFAAGSATLQTKSAFDEAIWVTVSGWTKSGERFRYLPAEKSFIAENLTSEAKHPEIDDLMVEELSIPSHDGTLVPLSLIYKRDLKKDGTAPVLIYGYGSHGEIFSPFFDPIMLIFPQFDGVLAVAHVRGGGEKGEAWHHAGQKANKPNTWKDLIACVEFLHKNKYSAPSKTALVGGSAGGILSGRAMIERPDLFAACISLVPVMNPLRFEHTPLGPTSMVEFGTSANEEECKALIEMDPYIQLKEGVKYPPMLLVAGMNDPRVPVWQPGKFVAKAQAMNRSNSPILFFVVDEAAHNLGDTEEKAFLSVVDFLSFALWQMGHPKFQME